MQPCKTGDQPYSDASPKGECSLINFINEMQIEEYLERAFRRSAQIYVPTMSKIND